MKKIVRLTESDLHKIVKESVNKLLIESSNNSSLIREVLLNGDLVNINNNDGYIIGVGFGDGNIKSFFYPYSERIEHCYCHVSIDEIKNVIEELKNEGYEFEIDGEYIFMKGERKAFKPFVPSKGVISKSRGKKVDTVTNYSNRLFSKSKDGNLHLF